MGGVVCLSLVNMSNKEHDNSTLQNLHTLSALSAAISRKNLKQFAKNADKILLLYVIKIIGKDADKLLWLYGCLNVFFG